MAALTQVEAVRRARLLAVDRYDIELDLTGLEHGSTLRSRTRIGFSCTEPGAATFADVVADELVSARLNGAELPASGWDGERLALTDLAERNVLEIETTTDRTGQQSGLHRSVDPADQQVYVWTSFEPNDARRVFACFDQPDLKAVFAFRVHAPAEWVVASGAPAEVSGAEAASRTWRFADTPRLSTYVTAVCAGPYVVLEREAGGRRLSLLARRSLEGPLRESADELFDLTERGLAQFAARFGTDLPLPAYTQVFCPEFFGAMENYACVAWSDSFLFRAPPTAAERGIRAVVLLHEMAHMWFGDLVTMRWWDDLWLNESFASWASHWALDSLDPSSNAWLLFLQEKEGGYRADRAPTTHPIYQELPDTAAAMASFDALTYAKGASVLKQLVATVGEERFCAGLSRYFGQHSWGNATLADLLAAVGEAAGTDLQSWARPWLRSSGAATLSFDAERGVLEQSVPVLPDGSPGPLRPHRLDLSAFRLAGDALEPLGTVPVSVDGASTPVAAGEFADADLVLVNDRDLTYARVQLDERSTRAALRAGATVPDPLSRGLLRLSLWQQVDDGATPPADVLAFVVESLRTENDPLVRGQLLATAAEGMRGWVSADAGFELGRRLTQVCLDRAAGDVDDEARTAYLRAAARSALPEQFDRVRTAIGEEVDLGWRVLVRRATFGEAPEEEIEQLLARDPNPEGWVRAAAVRGARPDVEVKDRVWRTVLEAESVSSFAAQVGEAFWQPGQDEVLRPFAERYLALLPALGGRNLVVQLSVPNWFFPVVGVDEDYRRRLVDAANAGDVSPPVRRSVLERADVLERMLRARSLA
jgi:aminopeptidase N